MKDIFRRKGKLKFSKKYIEENHDLVREILSNMIVIDVDREILNDYDFTVFFIYTGYSEEFDKCTGIKDIPVYDINVSESDSGYEIDIY